ncbi:MAG: phytanoyl-CoA dioxygenase family protein [Alphaproteobacteria bacterium]|nr:phytanoyl-CoA dioxygenase family protein [Alphaproteobacteria bacterium]
MAETLTQSDPRRAAFERDGFLSAVDILDLDEVADHRRRLEDAEASHDGLHYVSKVHTILRSPFELATHSKVLDVVEALIGPDILLFDVTYVIKESRSAGHVSWHQDLTYWGFDGDEQVSMWLALSAATRESGCMRMIPGSHRFGRLDHEDTADGANLLHRGQTVHGVAEDEARMLPLAPGQASFHHGWTLHASMPNKSNDRRIGLNAQYIAPRMRQLVNPHETALLVRGRDPYRHYAEEFIAQRDLDPAALARHAELDRRSKETWDSV